MRSALQWLGSAAASIAIAAGVAAADRPPEPAADQPPDPGAVLARAAAIYRAASGYTANIDVLIHLPDEKTARQTGVLAISGRRVALSLGDQTMVSDGVTLWLYRPGDNEVQITDSTNEPQTWEVATRMLSNPGDHRYAGQETVDGRPYHVIATKRLRAMPDLALVKRWVHRKTHLVEKVKLYGKDGTRYELSLRDIKLDRTLPAAMFRFDTSAHPGVTVTDLR